MDEDPDTRLEAAASLPEADPARASKALSNIAERSSLWRA